MNLENILHFVNTILEDPESYATVQSQCVFCRQSKPTLVMQASKSKFKCMQCGCSGNLIALQAYVTRRIEIENKKTSN